MAVGTVKKIFQDRGFGFIKLDNGSDIFFHVRGCQPNTFESLNIGDKVEYEIDPQQDKQGRGPRAINVKKA